MFSIYRREKKPLYNYILNIFGFWTVGVADKTRHLGRGFETIFTIACR